MTLPPTEPPQPTPKRWVWLLPTLMVVSALLVSGGLVVTALIIKSGQKNAPTTSGTFTLSGTLLLREASGVQNLDDIHCTGMGGYDDIHAGANVVISDASGTTVAMGSINSGTLIGSGPTRQCEFAFTVAAVPAGKGFYGVAIGHRDPLQYPEGEVIHPIELGLG